MMMTMSGTEFARLQIGAGRLKPTSHRSGEVTGGWGALATGAFLAFAPPRRCGVERTSPRQTFLFTFPT